jgi:hypothetical protein
MSESCFVPPYMKKGHSEIDLFFKGAGFLKKRAVSRNHPFFKEQFF